MSDERCPDYIYCNAPTKLGEPCSRPVLKQGDRCSIHQGIQAKREIITKIEERGK